MLRKRSANAVTPLCLFSVKTFSNILLKILLHHLQERERMSGGVLCRRPAGRMCSGKGVVWLRDCGASARVNLPHLDNSLVLEGRKFRDMRSGHSLVGAGLCLWCLSKSQSPPFVHGVATRSVQFFPF